MLQIKQTQTPNSKCISMCGYTSYLCLVGCKVNIEKSIEILNLGKTFVCKPWMQIADSNSRVEICKQRANFLPISLLSSCQPKANAGKQSRSFFVHYFWGCKATFLSIMSLKVLAEEFCSPIWLLPGLLQGRQFKKHASSHHTAG